MQLIGVEYPAPSVCSLNISGSSPSVRMTVTLPFGLTTQSMSGGCSPCSMHCLKTSRRTSARSSIFCCSQEKPWRFLTYWAFLDHRRRSHGRLRRAFVYLRLCMFAARTIENEYLRNPFDVRDSTDKIHGLPAMA